MSGSPGPMVLVTGASSGIGEATALLLAGEGFRVVGVSRSLPRLEPLLGQASSRGLEILAVEMDVNDDVQVGGVLPDRGRYLVFPASGRWISSGQGEGRDVVQEATIPLSTRLFSTEKVPESHFPSKSTVSIPTPVRGVLPRLMAEHGPIDVLVNNAGYGLWAPVETYSVEELRDQFETNLFAPVRLIKAVLPGMMEQRRGAIVNVSSYLGRLATPFHSAYASSKFALEGLSESLRTELRPFGSGWRWWSLGWSGRTSGATRPFRRGCRAGRASTPRTWRSI